MGNPSFEFLLSLSLKTTKWHAGVQTCKSLVSTWLRVRLEKPWLQSSSFGNYANMCIYITDYGKSFKNKLWYLHHRPGDSNELLCSSKSTPVCQLEVLQWSHEKWDETTRQIRSVSPPSGPLFHMGGGWRGSLSGWKNDSWWQAGQKTEARSNTGILNSTQGRQQPWLPHLNEICGMESGMIHF